MHPCFIDAHAPVTRIFCHCQVSWINNYRGWISLRAPRTKNMHDARARSLIRICKWHAREWNISVQFPPPPFIISNFSGMRSCRFECTHGRRAKELCVHIVRRIMICNYSKGSAHNVLINNNYWTGRSASYRYVCIYILDILFGNDTSGL